MTSWNASTSTFAILHFLLTLSSPTVAAAFTFWARHDGKSHKNHIHRGIDAKQDITNAPVAGLDVISSPVATLLPFDAISTISLPLNEKFETSSAMDVAAFSGQAAPWMKSMSAFISSSSRATITSFAPPVFHITVIQVPIYTICPGTPRYINATTSAASSTALYNNATATGNATDYIPTLVSAIPVAVSATALLSNGSYTTFSSQSMLIQADAAALSLSPNITLVPEAHIILGTDGCQTLYTTSTTKLCSTIITRGGQVPIAVSDCSQWVTFSSSTVGAPDATCSYPNIPATPVIDPATLTSRASQTPDAIFASQAVTPAFISSTSAGIGPGLAFFVAPWHEIAAGIIPSLVQVVDCPDNSRDSCTISSESWSVSTSTSTTVSTRTI